MTAPRPRAVVVGSLSLFAVLFVLLTIQLSAASSNASARHRKAQPAIVETRTDVAPEPEDVEPEPEDENIEPEIEEPPPVVTSSS